MGGMAEVELGKFAQQKATSDQVKQFGEHMVRVPPRRHAAKSRHAS